METRTHRTLAKSLLVFAGSLLLLLAHGNAVQADDAVYYRSLMIWANSVDDCPTTCQCENCECVDCKCGEIPATENEAEQETATLRESQTVDKEPMTTEPKQVLYFTAIEWCPPCRENVPEVERLVAAGWTEEHFKTIDVSRDWEPARAYDVKTVPTTLVVQGGKVIGRRSGMWNANQFADWVNGL